MKFLVLGCGSIGSRHIENIQKINSKNDIDVFDPQVKLRKKISKKFHINELSDMPKKKSDYDLVLICTPPSSHISLATELLKNNYNIFIEKPLSSNFNGIKKFRNLLKRKQTLAFVGYNLRFNDGLKIIKKYVSDKKIGKIIHASAYFGQYLPDWRPTQNYKKNYSFIKNLGGGIIHDSSHEIDYLSWILGTPMTIQSDYVKGITLKTDVEGLAEISLKFKGNVLANIHLDFVRREYRRTSEFLFENGIIDWSLKENTIKIFNTKNDSWKKFQFKQSLNDMYVEEMKHVINCVKNNKKSKIIDIDNGILSLTLSEMIIKAGKTGKKLNFD